MSCGRDAHKCAVSGAAVGIADATATWAAGRKGGGHCPRCGGFLRAADGGCTRCERYGPPLSYAPPRYRKLLAIARAVGERVEAAGGKMYLVGGCVRDRMLGVASTDIDVVVGGISQSALQDILRDFGDVQENVGNDFPVTKARIDGEELDFAQMRREAPTGAGYHDVQIETGPDVTILDDALRRDFTINAIYQDALSAEVIDPVGGVEDLKNGVFRHVSEKFTESNERPLRLMQQLARYPGFKVAPGSIAICRGMASRFHLIPQEQLRQQFYKLLVKGVKPGDGLRNLKETGFLACFPSLAALDGCPQDPAHHPEGDALEHTAQTLDAMAAICRREGITGNRRFKLMTAALIHDMGKPGTTTTDGNGRIVSPGHQTETGAAEAFLAQISCPDRMRPAVLALTREHMAHINEPTPKSVRRLSRRLAGVSASPDEARNATIEDLRFLMEADMSGRTADGQAILIGQTKNIARIRGIAEAEKIDRRPPADILMGRHLISELNLNPKQDGLLIGRILRQAREAQVEGVFTNLDGALEFARARLVERQDEDAIAV